jgi:imidazolonepropionase-like amidohydrolase
LPVALSAGKQIFRKSPVGDLTFMPRVHLRLAVVTTILLSVFLSATPFTRSQRSAINTYAITNARIVTLAGPVIDRGTVVIRDGLIVSVGANVPAPTDARVIDGTGLTVYPGLIDSSTSLGIPEPSPTPTPASGGGGGFFAAQLRAPAPITTGLNSTQVPGLQPEVRAEDVIRAGGDQIESARNAGITAALTAPRGGIWMGQSALINLAGDTPQEMLLRSPVAMHVGFTPLRGSYPGSLMGVFATLRQMLLDAQRYREVRQIYERTPRGVRRLPTDRSLEALIPVLDGRMPVVFFADREREIKRALELAAEFKLRAIIAGGADSWKVTDQLQKADVPVLLSLNFPRRTTTAMPQADPEPLRVLRERVDAPKTAARLAAAKVRFAFQSGAMTSIGDFVANAGKTIENGLLLDDALRALTIRPAEIFGVADRLGSIETGKIANLTVMRGDLFDRNSRVTHVFIDGRPVDLRPPATTPSAPEQARGAATGTWTLNVNLGDRELGATLILRQEANQLRGSMQGALGSSDIANAAVTESGEIRFTVPVTLEGQTTEASFTGMVTGNEMKGTVNITGRTPATFSGSRAATPN